MHLGETKILTDDVSPSNAIWQTIAWLLIGLGVMSGVALRIVAASEPLWLDELHTAWVIKDDFQCVAARSRIGNQSPLYFQIQWFTANLFGPGHWSLRSLSLVAGFGVIGISGAMVWVSTRSIASVAAVVWLIALEPNLIFYASEARPYALVQLAGLIQLVCFVWYLNREFGSGTQGKNSPSPYVALSGLVITSAFLIHLHYTAAFQLIAQATVIVGYLAFAKPQQTRRGVLTRLAAGTILGTVLLIPVFQNVVEVWNRKGNWASVSSVETLWQQSQAILISCVGITCIYFSLACSVHGSGICFNRKRLAS